MTCLFFYFTTEQVETAISKNVYILDLLQTELNCVIII